MHKKPDLVDTGVVDDLICDVQLPVWECLLCFVCHLHGALNAPAEAVRFCQLDSDIAKRKGVSLLAHLHTKSMRMMPNGLCACVAGPSACQRRLRCVSSSSNVFRVCLAY